MLSIGIDALETRICEFIIQYSLQNENRETYYYVRALLNMLFEVSSGISISCETLNLELYINNRVEVQAFCYFIVLGSEIFWSYIYFLMNSYILLQMY